MRFLLILVAMGVVSCTTSPTSLWSPTPHPDSLEQAVFLKKQKKLDQAEAEVLSYLQQSKDIYWQGAALLLMGEIQEESGKTSEAMATFQKLLNHGAGYETHHAAKALYKMSWIYERQNNCQQVIATLTDLQRQLLRGDEFVKKVETPARLANCYYLLNQWERAKTLRAESQKNYKAADLGMVPEDVRWRSYLYISFVGASSLDKTDRHLPEVIDMVQKDLLHLLERAPEPFNELAFKRLLGLYEDLFNEYTNKPKPKTAEEKNENNEILVKELASLVDLIEELKAAKSPKELATNNTDIFFMKIQNIEERARTIVRQLEVGMQKEKKQKR